MIILLDGRKYGLLIPDNIEGLYRVLLSCLPTKELRRELLDIAELGGDAMPPNACDFRQRPEHSRSHIMIEAKRAGMRTPEDPRSVTHSVDTAIVGGTQYQAVTETAVSLR